jgi:hypothetical protein
MNVLTQWHDVRLRNIEDASYLDYHIEVEMLQ